MALELRQSLKLSQQLVMTPQLQQAIKLLQLSRLELQQAVREELEVNPALEETSEETSEETAGEEAPAAEVSASPIAEEGPTPKEGDGLIDRVDWEYYFNEGSRDGRVDRDTDDEDGRPYYENTLTRRPGLTEHLEIAAAAPGHLRRRARGRALPGRQHR